MVKDKHDEDCYRRKEETGHIYVCTCGLTDEQVEAHTRYLRGEDIRDDGSGEVRLPRFNGWD